jgi:ABC-type multidrug transport system ATPase subunit
LGLLELKGIDVTSRGVARLERCSLAVRPGEILGLVGPTGSGKTAVLQVAAGLLAPVRGRLLLEGKDVTRKPARLRAAAALLTAGPATPGDLRAGAWLHLWAGLDAVPRGERKARVDDAVARFGLAERLDRTVESLSAGEQRRLQLARLWVRRPSLYLLDGPGDGLDGEGLARLTALLRDAAAAGATVILTATAPHLPTSVCDRVLHLEGGAVRAELARAEPDFKARVAACQGWAA